MQNNYIKVMEFLCEYYEVTFEEVNDILKKKEEKYLILLILKKYRCLSKERLMEVFKVKNSRSVIYSLKKAEEKFLINKEFREKYFDIENKIKKII
jgi:hypothetical protein